MRRSRQSQGENGDDSGSSADGSFGDHDLHRSIQSIAWTDGENARVPTSLSGRLHFGDRAQVDVGDNEDERDYSYACATGMPNASMEDIVNEKVDELPSDRLSHPHSISNEKLREDTNELDPSPDEDSDVECGNSHHNSSVAHKASVAEDAMPVCNKVSSILSERGFPVVKLIGSDVDATSNTISTFVVESWADAVLAALTESLDRIDRHEKSIKSSALSSRIDSVSKDSLLSKINQLEGNIAASQRRENEYLSKIKGLEEERNLRIKATTEAKIESKKLLKSSEQRIQEMERTLRLKETAMDRLREKLQNIADKERSTKLQRNRVLQKVRSGDLSFISSHSTTSNRESPHSTPHRIRRVKARGTDNGSQGLEGDRSTRNRAPNSSGTVNENLAAAVDALESQKNELFARNLELEHQVKQLVADLKDVENANGTTNSDDMRMHHNQTMTSDTLNHIISSSPTSAQMYETIKRQEMEIKRLVRELEVGKSLLKEQEDTINILRTRSKDLRDEISNLQTEINSRPTVNQLMTIERERDSLEEQLHDLIMMRGDSREMHQWRKHLSTADRIKIDKRNHDLGLWVIDSLPKVTMRELLQSICRELDISEISDLHPCVVKLKAVVRTIPRMERFISQVCTFIFQRHPTLGDIDGMRAANVSTDINQLRSNGEYSMEHVLPILRRWWYASQRCVELDKFYNRILFELYRRQEILAHTESMQFKRFKSDVDLELLLQQWKSEGKYQWEQRDPESFYGIIRDLVDFQTEVMHHDQSLLAADEYIRQRPELLISRIVSHIKYLFNIQTGIDGVIPRMNQIYLFTEEMRNFLATIRAMLTDMKGGTCSASASTGEAITNAMVLSEIQRRLGCSQKLPDEGKLNANGTAADGLLRSHRL